MYQINGIWVFPIAGTQAREYAFLLLEDGATPLHFEAGSAQSGGALELETA